MHTVSLPLSHPTIYTNLHFFSMSMATSGDFNIFSNSFLFILLIFIISDSTRIESEEKTEWLL
jgi:hypothetical protein